MPKPTSSFAQLLAARPGLSVMPTGQVRLVVAMRIVILAWHNKQDPKSYVTRQLGDQLAARHFVHIIEMMNDCWPEPLAVHRPCCSHVSYDEMLLLDLTTATVQKEGERFHGLLGEMIGRSDRQKLHFGFAKFVRRFARRGTCP